MQHKNLCAPLLQMFKKICVTRFSEQVRALFLLHSSLQLKGKANLTNTQGSLHSLHDNLQHKPVNSTLEFIEV